MFNHQLSYFHNEESEQDQQVLKDLKQWMNDLDIECVILHITNRKYNLSLNFHHERDLNFIIYCWELLQADYDLQWLHDNYFKGKRLLDKFYP